MSKLDIDILIDLLKKNIGREEYEVIPIAQSGSNRRYYRFRCSEDKSFVGLAGTIAPENTAFVEIANAFTKQGINAPKVLAISDDRLYYIQEDLGDLSLFDYMKSGRESNCFTAEQKSILHKTISLLPDIQYRVPRSLDFQLCYPNAVFDRKSVFFDLNYFKYMFAKQLGVELDEFALEQDFEYLADIILSHSDTNTFMYRDFQSRNIMIKDDEPYFIDFQAGRKGAIYYDVASFLWQGKANFPQCLRDELIDTYIESLHKYRTIDRAEFVSNLNYFVLFRMLQVLGAYGFRGLIEKKLHFIESIPMALNNIKEVIDYIDLPYIKTLFNEERIEFYKHRIGFVNQSVSDRLVVRVESFSYKKGGIPFDYSGNGGGYVFDCRSLHNPGRYKEYKHLTGKDEAVKDFLLANSDVGFFLDNIYSLVDMHIEVFQRRGFSHLSIFFGCTGGQHRSVFCAESMAQYLKKYDVDIKLKHNEQH